MAEVEQSRADEDEQGGQGCERNVLDEASEEHDEHEHAHAVQNCRCSGAGAGRHVCRAA